MSDEEKLFMTNPTKAMWIKLGQINEKLDSVENKINLITKELDDDEPYGEQDNEY